MKKFLLLIISTLFILNFGGNCMADTTLTTKQQSIVKISSYTARGDMENLEKALSKALDNEMTANQIKEILVQMYAYCGFPRSLNAITTFKKVVESRTDIKNGEEGKVLPANTDKFAYGDNVQVELTGGHIKGGVFAFAPAIDQYLKEHLFADIFARGVLTYQEREIATISALSSLEGVDSQLKSHIQIGKNTGLTDEQINAILDLTKSARSGAFALGMKNDAYAQYFIGQSYLQPLTTEGVNSANVTFEPGCRNNWHIHHSTRGGGQILICVDGEGWYQEEGKEAQSLKVGDVVVIPANVKHWNSKKKHCWFSHIAVEVPGENTSNEWCEEVIDEEYDKL